PTPANSGLSVYSVGTPSHGTASIITTAGPDLGKVDYVPTANYYGADSFTYVVSDNGTNAAGHTDTATVSINVTSVNDAPAGADKTVTTNEDADYTFATGDFGFSDPNDSPANGLYAVRITSLPGAGSLKNN